MAKVTNPLLSQDARGSVAGVQYSRNTSGNFASRKSTGTHSQRPGAVARRAAIGLAHHAFDALSPIEKSSWAAFAPHPLTGRNHYVSAYLTGHTFGAIPDNEHPPRSWWGEINDIVIFPPAPPAVDWLITWLHAGRGTDVLRVSTHASWTPFPSIHKRKWHVEAYKDIFLAFVQFDMAATPPYIQFLFEVFDWHTAHRVSWQRVDDDPILLLPARILEIATRWNMPQKLRYEALRLRRPDLDLPQVLPPIEEPPEPPEPPVEP